MPRSAGTAIFGWDAGGAHLKACRLPGPQPARPGPEGTAETVDAHQWACPLWQGQPRLTQALAAAAERWSDLRAPGSLHALTMSGEMVDAFADRQAGVQAIASQFEQTLAPARVQVYAGDAGWLQPAAAGAHWRAVASANWLALAQHAALASPVAGAGLLIDIGSTTSDLIAFAEGRVLTQARSDAERLASGELVYQGVVRTPLCALGPAVHWRGRDWPLVNEFFATTADVHRLCGGLDPAHDMQPAADQGAKDLPATRQRLARMLGLDAHEASAQDWLALAETWRQRQLGDLAAALQGALALHGLQARPGQPLRVLTAGCGAFLVPPLLDRVAQALAWPRGVFSERPYAATFAGLTSGRPHHVTDRPADNEVCGAAWGQAVQVAAPAAAVAALLAREVG